MLTHTFSCHCEPTKGRRGNLIHYSPHLCILQMTKCQRPTTNDRCNLFTHFFWHKCMRLLRHFVSRSDRKGCICHLELVYIFPIITTWPMFIFFVIASWLQPAWQSHPLTPAFFSLLSYTYPHIFVFYLYTKYQRPTTNNRCNLLPHFSLHKCMRLLRHFVSRSDREEDFSCDKKKVPASS